MGVELYQHQADALAKMHNGCILCGGVGTGKSRTALTYYVVNVCGGGVPILVCGASSGTNSGEWAEMKTPRDLYIITTAKKRDSGEWREELRPFLIFADDAESSFFDVKVNIDSWNNIEKYKKVVGAFFIFDEQRVVGSGKWVKSFWNIARKNKWILLSATPGDVWKDYIPVFVANGYFRNKTEFYREHCVFNSFTNYPKIERYVNEGKLLMLRNRVLVPMKYERETRRHHIYVTCQYDADKYQLIFGRRWNPYDDEPIQETGKLFYLMRRCVNEDESRMAQVRQILDKKKKAIIFYNYDYELETLRELAGEGYRVAEWNGHRHEAVPGGSGEILPGDENGVPARWVYLVQYAGGAEGWNCVTCDTIVFYSQSYSYRMTEQACGRIDRLNTKYRDLYYYHLTSKSPIDIAIGRALKMKRNFNERSFPI